MHSHGGTIWPSPGKKWLIFCLAGDILWQEFQQQWLTGARWDWKCKDPIGSGAAWESHGSLSPWLLGARRSSSCGLTRPERETCCRVPTEAAAGHTLHEKLCKSLPRGWWRLEERAGHQEHSVITAYLRISSSALLPKYSPYLKLLLPASSWITSNPPEGSHVSLAALLWVRAIASKGCVATPWGLQSLG